MSLPHRLLQLLLGLFLFGIASALMVRAGIGIAPWDVLAQGIARHSGLAFGLVTNLGGVGVLLMWWPLRQRPGLGTLAFALLIGPLCGITLPLFDRERRRSPATTAPTPD